MKAYRNDELQTLIYLRWVINLISSFICSPFQRPPSIRRDKAIHVHLPSGKSVLNLSREIYCFSIDSLRKSRLEMADCHGTKVWGRLYSFCPITTHCHSRQRIKDKKSFQTKTMQKFIRFQHNGNKFSLCSAFVHLVLVNHYF